MINFNNYFNHKLFKFVFIIIKKFYIKKKLYKYGSGHGQYYLPKLKKARKVTSILSGGAGDNISFDINLARLGYKVYLLDPTPKAKNFFLRKKKNNKVFNRIVYIDKALWNKNEYVNFYLPIKKKIISHSTIQGFKNQKKILVKAITVKKLIKSLKIKKFYLIKLDIEGSEYFVIKDIIKNNIIIKYFLIEFDFLKKSNLIKSTSRLIEILLLLRKNNYKLIYIDNLNFTFEKC